MSVGLQARRVVFHRFDAHVAQRKHTRSHTRPASPAPAGGRLPPSSWGFLAGLVAAGVAAYASSLALGFIYDDFTAIVGNEHIRHLWPLTAAAAAPPQSALAGRPVVSLSMAINFALGGLAPAGYHAWNLTVHVLCGVLLFAVLRR